MKRRCVPLLNDEPVGCLTRRRACRLGLEQMETSRGDFSCLAFGQDAQIVVLVREACGCALRAPMRFRSLLPPSVSFFRSRSLCLLVPPPLFC
eukprot:786365-Pleurochrysis_carterae.AAC.1